MRSYQDIKSDIVSLIQLNNDTNRIFEKYGYYGFDLSTKELIEPISIYDSRICDKWWKATTTKNSSSWIGTYEISNRRYVLVSLK